MPFHTSVIVSAVKQFLFTCVYKNKKAELFVISCKYSGACIECDTAGWNIFYSILNQIYWEINVHSVAIQFDLSVRKQILSNYTD